VHDAGGFNGPITVVFHTLQVVIKLNTIEPESLAGDILAQSNKVLHHRG
jgi:hypothetical protein